MKIVVMLLLFIFTILLSCCNNKEDSKYKYIYSSSNSENKKEYKDSSENIHTVRQEKSDSNRKMLSFPEQNCQAVFAPPLTSQMVKVIQRTELPRYIMTYSLYEKKIEDYFYYAEEKTGDLKVAFYLKTELTLADSFVSVSEKFKQHKKAIRTKGYGFFLNDKEIDVFNNINPRDRTILIPKKLSYVTYHNKNFLIVYLSAFFYNSSRYMRPPIYFCILEIEHKQVKSMKLYDHIRTLSEEYLLNMAKY